MTGNGFWADLLLVCFLIRFALAFYLLSQKYGKISFFEWRWRHRMMFDLYFFSYWFKITNEMTLLRKALVCIHNICSIVFLSGVAIAFISLLWKIFNYLVLGFKELFSRF